MEHPTLDWPNLMTPEPGAVMVPWQIAPSLDLLAAIEAVDEEWSHETRGQAWDSLMVDERFLRVDGMRSDAGDALRGYSAELLSVADERLEQARSAPRREVEKEIREELQSSEDWDETLRRLRGDDA